MLLTYLYVSDNMVLLRRQCPCTIVYLWLTNTKRMTHLDDTQHTFVVKIINITSDLQMKFYHLKRRDNSVKDWFYF